MKKKNNMVQNAPLQPGDKAVCLRMDDAFSPITPGMPGVVKNVDNISDVIIYNVDWKNGSKLSLVDGYDKWVKIESEPETEEPLNESKIVLVRTKYDILNKNY
jgi:hypothetical protein